MGRDREEVECEVEQTVLPGDHADIPSVVVTCGKCGHQTEAFGTGPKSVRRCLVALREECPMGEENWYYAADGSDQD